MISSSAAAMACRIGLLDVAPVTDIVAHQESRCLVPARLRFLVRDSAQAVAAIEFCPQDQLPQAVQRQLDRCQQRPFDAHRVVVAWRQLMRGVQIVNDIDATDESNFTIDHHQLAVQTPETMATQMKAGDVGSVDHCLNTGRHQPWLQPIGKLAGTETVDEDANRDAAARGIGHRCGDGTTRGVVLEDVTL
jgi:hypothetical protein